MKLLTILLTLFLFTSTAEAKNYNGYKNSYMTGNTSKPAKWCGWFARKIFGGGPEYNLARNWAKRGKPSSAKVGAVVVWKNHVGYISGKSSRGWIITSGNDGNRVRSRVRSLSKVIAIRDLS